MEAYNQRFIVPMEPQPNSLPIIYPWEDTNLIGVCKKLYETAIRTGYTGTFQEFKDHFGEYLESGVSIVDYDEYNGQYTVTPLPNVDQILRTQGKYLRHDIVIEPIPYAEVSNTAGGTTCIIG